MKKLLVLSSAFPLLWLVATHADISVSGSAGLGAVSGNGSATNIYSGGAVSFALSSDLETVLLFQQALVSLLILTMLQQLLVVLHLQLV